MERNDVVKALQLCTNMDYGDPSKTCGKCPYRKFSDDNDCTQFLMRDALVDLLNPPANELVWQYRWERDVALEQLKSIGKNLGEKMDDIQTLIREAKHDLPNGD